MEISAHAARAPRTETGPRSSLELGGWNLNSPNTSLRLNGGALSCQAQLELELEVEVEVVLQLD